ncbi:hypothetical protein LCGC14_1858070 [marine sediment metagenome]|uniref:Uncharacterized protein n=1 Tax=marine sediment metagenome TaxID=412755 RepID=A0A0F9GWR0_9ZZZZ
MGKQEHVAAIKFATVGLIGDGATGITTQELIMY